VMLGRGCYGALAGFADVLDVRIQAPLPVRIKWAIENEDFADAESAEAFVKETEAVRASFVKDCYGLPMDDAGLFDLVIDTEKVPAEMATRWLVEVASALADRGSGEGRTTASIQVDPVIARVASGVIDGGLAHR
jgi:cytidylate kinase